MECLGAQSPAYKHKQSQLTPQANNNNNNNNRHLIAPIGGANATSTSTGVTIRPRMSIDCLYVQRRLLSVCLRRRRNICANPPYRERGNAPSASFRSMNAEITRAHTPPIAYRTHSNTLQRLQVDTGLSLVQIHAQDPRSRLICGN
jgi:hypothetical protein